MSILFERPQSLFAATKIYILIFNVTHSLISLMGSIFPNEEYYSQFIDKFIKFQGMEYLYHLFLSLKCDHPVLCEFSILFSTLELKLGHKFSQLSHGFNIEILKYWSGAVYISKFFPIHKRNGELEFLKSLDCISKFSPIH